MLINNGYPYRCGFCFGSRYHYKFSGFKLAYKRRSLFKVWCKFLDGNKSVENDLLYDKLKFQKGDVYVRKNWRKLIEVYMIRSLLHCFG